MAKLKTKFIEADAVTGAKMRLDNDQFLRGRNNADSADVNLIKVNTSDQAEAGAELSMNSQKIVSLANGTASGDAVNKGQLDLKAADADVIKKDGSVAFTGDQSMGSNKLTNLATPTADTDAATKGYVDSVAEGLDVKDSVRAASTANIDLGTASDPNPIDGVTLANGDRILLKDQTTGSENGIYDAVTATDPTTWVRSADADEDSEVTAGLFVFVEEGTAAADTGWVLTTDDPITVDTTSLSFSQFSGAGSIAAGAALSKSGDTLNVNVDDSSIEISGDNLQVKASGVTDAMLAQDYVQTSEVDNATVKFSGAQLSSLIPDREVITLDGTDISNGYVDLLQTIHSEDAVAVIPVGGIPQERGVDYTVSVSGGAGGVTRVSFAGDLSTELASGDKLIVNYQYL